MDGYPPSARNIADYFLTGLWQAAGRDLRFITLFTGNKDFIFLIQLHPLGQHFMGWGENRVRFVGHGVGLELDELPVLAPGQTMALAPGQVLAIEPKFFHPGVGAVGLENTYEVTGRGLRKITVTPDEAVIC